MIKSTPPPSTLDVQRFERIKEIGCIACRMRSLGPVKTEVHHLTTTGRHGGKRRGHRFTVGLCAWHHRGEPTTMARSASVEWMFDYAGPSLARHARKFRAEFGIDQTLLEYQDQLLRRRFGDDAAPPPTEEQEWTRTPSINQAANGAGVFRRPIVAKSVRAPKRTKSGPVASKICKRSRANT